MCSIISKLPDIPNRLYMYFRAENAIKFLEDHNLKFSNYDLVNDPFECTIDFNRSLSTTGFLAYNPHATPLTDRDIYHLQTEWRDRSKSLRIACFTTDPTSVLMWAYYADGQKGICIEFDPSKDPLFFENLRQVKYEAQMPTINRHFCSLDYSDILVTKSAHWSHEQEWRVIRYDLQGDFFPITPAAITGIIWGCSIARYYNDVAKSDTRGRLFCLLQRLEYEHIHLQCIVASDKQTYELQCKDMPLFVLMRSSHTVVVVSLKEQYMKIHYFNGRQYVVIYEASVYKWEQTAISLPNGHYLISNDDEDANINLDVID